MEEKQITRGAGIAIGGGYPAMSAAVLAAATAASQSPEEKEIADQMVADHEKTEALMALVDDMNTEMDSNEGLRTFLVGLSNLIKRAGKAIPRKLLLENGTPKKTLNRLIKAGFIRELYLRHQTKGTMYVCIDLPEGVMFKDKRAVAVLPAADTPSLHEKIEDGATGADEVVTDA